MSLYYVVGLLALFYMLIIAEFFLPTGGLLGIACVATLIAAIIIAFSYSLFAGVVTVLFVLGTLPLMLFVLVRVWPHTPIGRRMLNRRPGQIDDAPPARRTPAGVPLTELIGRKGVARTHLLPSGQVLIDGEKLDAVSTGAPIDAGDTVSVTSIDGGRVRVRLAPTEENDPTPHPPKSPASLEESLDTFDVE